MLSSLNPAVGSPLTLIGTLAALGIIVLFGTLVQKEFAGARSGTERVKVLGQVVLIGLGPLLIALILVMVRSLSLLLR